MDNTVQMSHRLSASCLVIIWTKITCNIFPLTLCILQVACVHLNQKHCFIWIWSHCTIITKTLHKLPWVRINYNYTVILSHWHSASCLVFTWTRNTVKLSLRDSPSKFEFTRITIYQNILSWTLTCTVILSHWLSPGCISVTCWTIPQ